MKFFSIFCVVLYVHTGVTLPYRNNTQVVFSEKPTSTKNTQISDVVPHTHNYSNDIPSNLNSQRQEVLGSIPNIQERGKDKYPWTKHNITLEQQDLPSKWVEKGSLSVQNPTDSILKRTSTLPQNLKNGRTKVLHNEGSASNQPNKDNQILRQTANLPRSIIFSSNTYETQNSNRRVDHDYQNRSNIKQQPMKPEADIRLDLQGISLENIESSLGQSSFGSPTESELPTTTDLNLNKDNSMQYIIKKAKQMHNIYASDKKLKRYTIIHPDGAVEHTDDLEKVSVTHPNYVMVKYSDLSKYNTNVSETATEVRPKTINQGENLEMMPKTLNNADIELGRPDTGSTVILLRKEILAPEVMNDDKHIEEPSSYSKKNVLTNNVNARNLDKTMLYESIAPYKTSDSDTVSKTDFAITTPTSVTVPQNNTVNTKITTLENSTPGPSHSRPFSEGNYSNSQDNTNISNTPSSQPRLEDVDYSGIWYQDKDFWDQLKNNAQYNLLFFMYVPTAPQVRKEITTTIYPNGTTVEEVTEIVDGKDGFPVATKTTKVTLAEDEEVKSEKKL